MRGPSVRDGELCCALWLAVPSLPLHRDSSRCCVGADYCAEGSAAPLPCPGGTTMDASLAVMTSVEQCLDCREGTFCPVGSANATLCAPGTINPLVKQESCVRCEAGKYQDLEGNTTCKPCPRGCATRCVARTDAQGCYRRAAAASVAALAAVGLGGLSQQGG